MPRWSHPEKHLIRGLWPDKHLYAATLLILASSMGAAFAYAAHLTPVTFAPSMPRTLQGIGWPFDFVLSVAILVLAILCYRRRATALGFVAAALAIVSVGALGTSSLLGLAAIGFLLAARAEGEHLNPETRDLPAHAWPDKALAATLLLVVAALASLVWGGMLLSGWLSVRTVNVFPWAIGSLAVGVLAIVGAVFCYRQTRRAVAFVAAAAVVLSGSFLVVGPGLGIATIVLLLRAHSEGEFDRG